MRYGIILCSIGLLVAGAVYAEDIDTGTPTDNTVSTPGAPITNTSSDNLLDSSAVTPPADRSERLTGVSQDARTDVEHYKLVHYLKLNTESLGHFEEIAEKEYAPPRYEINSFAMISLIVNEENGTKSVYELLEKIKPISYIIRAQVKRAETPDWQELIVISSFTRILSKKSEASPNTDPNHRTDTPTKTPITDITNTLISTPAYDTTAESSFELYKLPKEFFELTPYFNEGMPVTVLDSKLYSRFESPQDEKAKKIKEFLQKCKTIFSFNAANCYIRDVNGKPTYFEAKEGDRLRIQIFRVEPLLTSKPCSESEIPYLESELYFTFREYGWFVHVSPGAFYMADLNRRNFNAQNFDLTTNGPGGGFNLYFSYTGTSGVKNALVNYVLPSISCAVVGYRDKDKIVGKGTAKESAIKKVNESKFSAGLAWPVIPMPKLRDLMNVSVLLYDLDFDHVLIGFSISANLDIQTLFKPSENPKVKVHGKHGM